MTREQFIERWKHQLLGLILDAAISHRTGSELSLFLEHTAAAKLYGMLGRMHQELTAEETKK